MIKHIMVALVLVIGLSGVGSADDNYRCWDNGDEYGPYNQITIGGGTDRLRYHSSENNIIIYWYYNAHDHSNANAGYMNQMASCVCAGSGGTYWNIYDGDKGSFTTTSPNDRCFILISIGAQSGSMTLIVNPTDITAYTISGNTSCVEETSLYILEDGNYYLTETTDQNTYSFDILNNSNYRLSLDSHNYDFLVNGSNIEYDYNACIETLYNFEEACGNLIPDSEGFYIEKIGNTVYAANNFYVPSGILTISQSPADNIYISANPFSGQIGWFLDPIVNDTAYTLTNPIISWSLKVIVQNDSTGALIDDAMVKVNQSCYCTDGYSVRQKMTTNGHTDFTDMSLQDAGLFVMASGYKILDETSTGYAAFLSGRSNFSSKTWIVKLAPSWSENSSTFYESNNIVNIFFKNEAGNRTSKILDTDSNVYLYYENNNTNEEAMTLRFESSSTHSYFMPELQWNIPHGEIGHKTIANSYFTPWDYSYRAVIYNSSIYGWNMTIPLTVRNATKEENQQYENLSTDLWFMYANAGKIDYRNDMDICVHACSNNTSLMYVDIELYKDNVLLCYKNLTWADFTDADFSYYYVWSPAYSYEDGSNYSVRMYGFDRTLLETDYVDCYTDDITRKNKLTVIVKNQYGTNLDNVFVYLEDYGSIPTGSNYYASFEGLDNGYYRFKATKPDYTGTGWDDITLSDSDEIVTYVLTSTDSEAGSATQAQKMDENELQNIYLIIMAFLLIFIIIGGLKYAL